jgi:midasin
VSDENGKLVFQEGALVEAVRNGHWIILDELNLAPSEVLEALNRLLDDNRELYIPETQEVVTPHPHFMLFATQNPPGLYGGRKVLSRAFRNRFLELHIDDIPARPKKSGEPSELETILKERTTVPPSHCARMVQCMLKLQEARQRSNAFAGKHGFITPRDLLRWAERCPDTKEDLAREGYMLLSERLRLEDEKDVVRTILQNECGAEFDVDTMYESKDVEASSTAIAKTKKAKAGSRKRRRGDAPSAIPDAASDAAGAVVASMGGIDDFKKVALILESVNMTREESGVSQEEYDNLQQAAAGLKQMVFTKSLQRLFSLVGRCIKHQEPVLLVGETGCGKTTVCQLYSILLKQVTSVAANCPLFVFTVHRFSTASTCFPAPCFMHPCFPPPSSLPPSIKIAAFDGKLPHPH